MILVADAGSTKTSWALIQPAGARHFGTGGINPYFCTKKEIAQKISNEFPGDFPYDTISEIRFFGAGCAGEERKAIVRDALREKFPETAVYVENDLLGAAIALCKDAPGIACILGTGSNSCCFDGKEIVARTASGGYILGDEGGGAYIGKKLLADFLRKKIPVTLEKSLAEEFQLDEQEVLRRVYTEKEPNRFLASLVPFVHRRMNEPYCRQLVESAFADFYAAHISGYPAHEKLPVHFTGSVAFQFIEQLKSVLEKNDRILGVVVRQPIEELVRYYQLKM
jgi:N-acetylglucosamine kinase-like BadF-type ATPase